MEVSQTIQSSHDLFITYNYSNRRLDNKFNIFEGALNNWFFLAINVVMIGGQVMIIFVGGKAFNVVHLNGAQWIYSIVLGFFSIPVGAVIRLIPDELVLRFIPSYMKQRPQRPEVLISDEEEHFRFPKPLADIREELSFLKKVKGGRLNNLRFAMQQTRDTFLTHSRSGSRSRSNSLPQTPEYEPEDSFGTAVSPVSHKRGRSGRSRSNSALGATTVMAGIIAGSVAGWSPIERPHGDGDTAFPRPRAKSDLDSRVDPATIPSIANDGATIGTTNQGEDTTTSNAPQASANPSPPKPTRMHSH
jgi:Ca2+-transporting ATPase